MQEISNHLEKLRAYDERIHRAGDGAGQTDKPVVKELTCCFVQSVQSCRAAGASVCMCM